MSSNPTMPAGRLKTVEEALDMANSRLQENSESYRQDAQVLLAKVTGKEKEWLLAHREAFISGGQIGKFTRGLYQLEKGIPLPYVIGEWEFFGLSFKLNTSVLIPRPETELLIETALDWLGANPIMRKGLDVGTGSGCIAVALAVNSPDLNITASDISGEALKVAASNFEKHQVSDQISLSQSDLLDEIKGKFDLICANLPYIPHNKLLKLDVYKKEPTLALDGGKKGLELIKRFLEDVPKLITSGGLILLEIDESQGKSAAKLAKKVFRKSDIQVTKDLAGMPRLLVIEVN